MYHVGMSRNVMLSCTDWLWVPLGCIHDNVHTDNVLLAQHRLEPSSCTCHPQSLWYMLFPTLTFWASCLWFQPGTTAPFCAMLSSGRARLWQPPVLHQHVVHGLAQWLPRPCPLRKRMGIKRILCQFASHGLRESFCTRQTECTCKCNIWTQNTDR